MGAFSEMAIDRQGAATAPAMNTPAFEESAWGDMAAPAFSVQPPQRAVTPPTPAMPKAMQMTIPEPSAEELEDEDEASAESLEEDAEDAEDTEPAVTPQSDAAEAEKRAAHEAAEAKRKAEWEAKRAARRAEEQAAAARLAAMSDDDVMTAAMQRVGADTERLTRRNMKVCVMEDIQTKCLDDPAFARLAMAPRKSMLNCFHAINRRAREYLEQEMKDNDEKPMGGGFGGDVPDELCYQWAAEYFRDPNAPEDAVKEEAFVPKPYPGKAGAKAKAASKAKKAAEKKPPKPAPKEEPKQQDMLGQLTFGDLAAEEVGAA